ncbi:MAG: hypothetical protein G01um101433_1117, partial [Parcubacteria group bacterium Gr01-1014_33]
KIITVETRLSKFLRYFDSTREEIYRSSRRTFRIVLNQGGLVAETKYSDVTFSFYMLTKSPGCWTQVHIRDQSYLDVLRSYYMFMDIVKTILMHPPDASRKI